MTNNTPQIQENIAKICLKLDTFLDDIEDATSAIESYRGMENVDNKAIIEDYENANVKLFTDKKNKLYTEIRSLVRSIK